MSKQQLSRFGVRLPLALAAAAAIATAAVLAAGGSAQAPPTSLHLVSKEQRGVGFFPRHRPHQGDRFGFGDTITGDDTGVDRGVCTLIGKSASARSSSSSRRARRARRDLPRSGGTRTGRSPSPAGPAPTTAPAALRS